MGLCILIVDDSIFTRLQHAAMVEGLGATTLLADNGMNGLELLTRHHVDLVIVDLNMPVMDGYTFLRELRSIPEFTQLPVIVATTQASEEDKRRGYEAGADLYLVKPLTQEVIQRHIPLLVEDPS